MAATFLSAFALYQNYVNCVPGHCHSTALLALGLFFNTSEITVALFTAYAVRKEKTNVNTQTGEIIKTNDNTVQSAPPNIQPENTIRENHQNGLSFV